MEINRESPFIRGIENRLDAIFESDKDQPDQAAADIRNLKEDDPLKEVVIERDVSDTSQTDGKRDFKVDETIDSTQSSFLRGIENRLDAIFESDKDQPDQAAADIRNLKEGDPLKEVVIERDVSDTSQADGKKEFTIDEAIDSTPSQLLQGIDSRLDAIFGAEISGMHHLEEDDHLKEVAIETDVSDMHHDDDKKDFKIDENVGMTEKPSSGHEKENHLILGDSNMPDHTEEAGIHNISEPEILKKAVAETELSSERDNKVERFEQLFEELITSTSIWFSPLKDLKSTVLSIEWELTDESMEKFDKEVNKLINLFAEDNIVLGFLMILRFLGRYIKAKGIEAHYVSIKLLLSVYDDLERVLLTQEMTGTKKHAVLLGNIGKYREWVETVDLTVRQEDKWAGGGMPPEAAKQAIPDRHEEDVITEPIIISKIQERTMEETKRPSKDEVSSLDPISGMTPHEAFAYALDEIKKVISAEFSALKAELKLWRQGQ
jgi:flagellar biosynthesis regulator FlbT